MCIRFIEVIIHLEQRKISSLGIRPDSLCIQFTIIWEYYTIIKHSIPHHMCIRKNIFSIKHKEAGSARELFFCSIHTQRIPWIWSVESNILLYHDRNQSGIYFWRDMCNLRGKLLKSWSMNRLTAMVRKREMRYNYPYKEACLQQKQQPNSSESIWMFHMQKKEENIVYKSKKVTNIPIQDRCSYLHFYKISIDSQRYFGEVA